MNTVARVFIVAALALFVLISLAPLFFAAFEAWPALARLPLPAWHLDRRQCHLLATTATIAASTAVFSLCLALPYALCLDRVAIKTKRALFCALLLPLFIPPYISAVGWLRLFGPEGFLRGTWLFGTAGVVFILGLAYFPIPALMLLAGLRNADWHLEQAALLVYPRRQVLGRIVVPLLAPYACSGVILVFVFSLFNYEVPDLLRVTTYPVEIFTQFSAFYDAPKALATALPLILLAGALLGLEQWLMAGREYISVSSQSRSAFSWPLRRAAGLAAGACWLLVATAVGVPLVALLLGAGSDPATYLKAWQTGHSQLLQSVYLSALAATLMSVLAVALAYAIVRLPKRAGQWIDTLIMVGFSVPPVIYGIALIRLWNRPQTNVIYQSALIVIFGLTARFCAFSVRSVCANLRQIHPHLEEAAALVPGSAGRRFWRIVAPLLAPGFWAGWLLAFSMSMGELGTSLLVIPAGETTLTIRIYTLLHYGAHKLVCALCLMLIGALCLAAVAICCGPRLVRWFAEKISLCYTSFHYAPHKPK